VRNRETTQGIIAHIVNRSKVYPVFQRVPLELPVGVHDNLSIRVVDRNGLGITMSSSVTGSARMRRHGPSRGLHTLRSWLQQLGPGVPIPVTRQISTREDNRCRERRVGKYGSKWLKWGGPKTCVRHHEDLHDLMRVWESERRYFKTPCSSGRASQGWRRTKCLFLCAAALPRLK
jgi:hypothetical protein